MPNPTHTPGELKACAHCGGTAHIGTVRYSKPLVDVHWEDGSEIREAFFAHCASCSIGQRNSLVSGYRTEAEAAAKWNHRTVDTELLEALRWIAANYENGHINHVDFRVEAKHRADAAITKAGSAS